MRTGPFVVVSGRAAPGEFDAAIRGTLAQLRGDLERVGLDFDRVVQIKSFVGDISMAQRLEEIVAATFGIAQSSHTTMQAARHGRCRQRNVGLRSITYRIGGKASRPR